MMKTTTTELKINIDHWDDVGFVVRGHYKFRKRSLTSLKQKKLLAFQLVSSLISYILSSVHSLLICYRKKY